MDEKRIQELLEIIQSSNINFLLVREYQLLFCHFSEILKKKLNEAKTDNEKEILYKEYLNNVMLPKKRC